MMLPVPRRMPFPQYGKICRIFTCSYIDYLDTQLIFTQVHFMDLLSGYPLGYSFGGPSDMSTTLLGVSEILAIEDLELPVLLDKSENGETIVGVRGSKGGRVDACALCCG